MLFTIIETFWCGDVTDIRVLPHFQFNVYKYFLTISSLVDAVLNVELF